MSPRFRFAALMISFVLPGCTTTGGMQTTVVPPPDVTCPASGACIVPVTVERWPIQCVIHCNPVVPDKVYGRAGQSISWELPAGTWSDFADDGITFKEEGAGLTCAAAGNSSGNSGERTTKWTCQNDGRHGSWKYTIHLHSNLTSSQPVDPWVVNQ